MPTVFRHDGFRFFLYSNEGSPLEPVHIHVLKPVPRRSSGFGRRSCSNEAMGLMLVRCAGLPSW